MLRVGPDGSRRIEAAHDDYRVGPDGSRRIVWMIIGMIKAIRQESDGKASSQGSRIT